MNTTRVFDKMSAAWVSDPRYISSCGGTRSSKTYSALQLFIIALIGEESRGAAPTVNSVVSESMPHLKRGAIRDFQRIMKGDAIWQEARWSETAKTYTFGNGSILEFFSVDDAGKVFGSARDRIFVNEAQHIKWETFRQLAVRTRGLIMCDYNPTHSFWLNERIETKDNCITVHSTYNDNQYLTPEQVREIEDNRHDTNWWTVFGEGKVGTLEGVVYDFDIVRDLPDTSGMLETYGLDFGFTNSITAVVRCFIHKGRKDIYLDEVLYRKGLLNSDIADALRSAGVSRSSRIYADAAEPKSIKELETYGFNIVKCDKTSTADKHNPITAQISFLKTWHLHVTQASLNLIDEMRGYVWDTDRNGERLNVPVKVRDHACDAFRYACYTPLAQEASGNYTISFPQKRTQQNALFHH
jgi:phage terminase large subunit